MSAFLLLLAAAAAAAPATSPSEQGLKAMRALHGFGECIVKAAPAGARELVVMDHQTAEYRAKLLAVLNGPGEDCQKKAKGLNIGSALLAGVMAEALLDSQFQPDVPAERLGADPQRQPIGARNELELMALCTVLNAPKVSSRLFASEPGSAVEGKALAALKPTVNGCLKKGANMNATPPAMRSLLALAAWRIVTTPKKAGK